MSPSLDLTVSPERLDEGTPEERAAFGLFVVRTPAQSLTEGFDHYINSCRSGPLVSGYHVAEWLAWNWWRLRHEPRSNAEGWSFAHGMTSIGEGYVWPNLTIYSDGVRTVLLSRPSSDPKAKPYRYFGAPPTVVSSTLFESAVDTFLSRIIGRLREQGVGETNLDRLWSDLLIERSDPHLAIRRKLEALLGLDPGEAEEGALAGVLADGKDLGQAAMEEMAAESAQANQAVMSGEALADLAKTHGFEASVKDSVRLGASWGRLADAAKPAWRLGAEMAKALRDQEGLGGAPLGTTRLAEMIGTRATHLADTAALSLRFSFCLEAGEGPSQVVLRSRWPANRRFHAARLLADRLFSPGERLHPATEAGTYRQKVQRAFAAEFLAPFEGVEAMMAGDFSPERQEDVAEHFNVSAMTINAILKNNKRLVPDEFEQDF
ncbi:hypothetical protein [Rhodospirillum rubrum]|uniref:hypothetical protein n=2 Tax=Rhodospirillum rubrum TaxID=1085 RepID=UPI0028AFF729|nr:hypothetical protein [Rhodospirillum rubrum]